MFPHEKWEGRNVKILFMFYWRVLSRVHLWYTFIQNNQLSHNQHNFTGFERSKLMFCALRVTKFEWITNFYYRVVDSTLAYSKFHSFCSQFHKLKYEIESTRMWNWLRAKVKSTVTEVESTAIFSEFRWKLKKADAIGSGSETQWISVHAFLYIS